MVTAGDWQAESAEARMQALCERMLPNGMQTPDHYFYSLRTETASAPIGGLWFSVMEKDGERFVFVMDIQVFDAYRRQGFGSPAFLQLEELARDLGVKQIMLNVVEHNHAARTMYEKLGYRGRATEMSQPIS